MTAATSESTAHAIPPADPHASKIAPDDPRLRLRAPSGRTLKKGPAIALVVALGGTVAVSLIASLLPSSKSADTKKPEPESPAAAVAPAIPETIRNAPERPLRRPPPPTDRLPVTALPSEAAQRAALDETASDSLPPEPLPAAGPRPAAMPRRDLRIEENLRARGSAILFDPQRGGAPASAPAAPSAAAPALSPQAPGRAAAPSEGFEADPNLQGRKNSFLDSEGARRGADVLQTRLLHPLSPYEIKAGTIIPAVLITAINSDLPGPVIGQVRESVYDTTTGNYLLIPQGSRLLAHYDSMVAWGQERVLVCWNRLLFPNGDSISLECMPAADLQGAAGLADEVDEHWGRILKGAAVASLLAATTQAIAGNTQGYNPTVPQTWARGAAGEMNQAGQQITGRNLSIQPTITVRAGLSVNVIVTKDLVMPRPYQLDPTAVPRAPSNLR